MTRSDLSPGLQAAQAAHAGIQYAIECRDECLEWFDESMYLVLLAAKDLNSLESLRDQARTRMLLCSEFFEPDLDNELTAIVLEPSRRSGRFVSSLPLVGKEVR